MHDANPDVSAVSATLRLAEATIGAVHVGIPADAVVQGIAAPDTPSQLPRRQGALCGIVDYEGMLVPVVDLARWVDVGAAPAGPGRILILRDGARVLGLQVSGVGGLVDVDRASVTRLHRDDGPEEVFHSAARSPESGHILSLLDVDRLATLAAAWGDGGATLSVVAAPEPIVTTMPYALLRAGALRLGVPAADLAEVLPMPALEGFGGGIGGAYCMWRGRHLPVLGPDVLGAYLSTSGVADLRAPGLLAVLEQDGLALGVPVHAVLELAAFDPAEAHVDAPGAVTATVYDGNGAVGLIDTAALFARCPEAALSKPDGAPRMVADGKLGIDNEVACIVFEADGMGAATIDCVEQVLPLTGPVDATMPWDGRAIAMVDLRPAQARGGSGHVLIVRGADLGHVACVVTRVHLMIPAGTGRLYRMGAGGANPVQFITTGDGAERASYRMIDLAA